MIEAALTGFVTGTTLILAIGAQNAFVLRQGLLGAHVGPLVLLFSLSDLVLMAAGAAGFSAVVTLVPWFPTAMLLLGAAFLGAYGLLRLRAAWTGAYEMALAGGTQSLGKTLAIGAAFTWLNPHVYLDTLALMGAISTQFEGASGKVAFVAGGSASSFVFFSVLGYGARWLAPVMQTAAAWRWLDVLVGFTMLALAATLLAGL
ncbi:MAG: LysE family transporter [Pseudomonadota bacterium]